MDIRQIRADLIRWILDIDDVGLLGELEGIMARDLREPKETSKNALILKITLEGISKPPVWRQILIRENASFEMLHYAIQVSFGLYNAHLWEFAPKPFSTPKIGPELEDLYLGIEPGDTHIASQTPLSSYFKRPKDQFYYVYDMGDSWTHKIVLKKIEDEETSFPTCVAGKGACPPEDCGGIPGYYMLVEALNNPKHPDHGHMMEWMEMEPGESWNVDAFDLIGTQAEIKEIFSDL